MTNRPEFSFIICTYNRAQYLRDTLDSLLSIEPPPVRVEILVVDNNSTDETQVLADKLPVGKNVSVRYVKEENQGLSHARNRGIHEALAPIVVFVDDDIRAADSFFTAWVSFFKNNPGAEAAGGKIHVQFDDPRPRWMPYFLLPLLGYHDFGNTIKRYGKKNYPFGGNMAFKKEIFDKYGLFNPHLGRIGGNLKASEEKEFFHRLRKDQADIYYVPDAMLFHRVSKNRLTEAYIRKQAVGLGQSIALQLQEKSTRYKMGKALGELGKIAATAGLFVGYSITLRVSKAIILIKFRKWIAEGYLSVIMYKSNDLNV
ncbi:MAG: glycosyltransferase [Balneolaceae bacterium]